MQVYANPFRILPVELLGTIYSFLNEEHKKQFSTIDKTIQSMSWELIRSVRLFPPYSGASKGISNNTLVDIIKRYKNAFKLTLGPKHSLPSTGCEGFSQSEEVLLRTMAVFFKSNPKLPFRKIELIETKTSAELHGALIESFKLEQIQSIVIRLNGSLIGAKEIQPILNTGLKKFKLIGSKFDVGKVFFETLAIPISFELQPDLVSAKFRHLHLPLETIQSLKTCEALETLVLDQCYYKTSDIKAHLAHSNLKRLEIINIPLLSDNELDTFTKPFSKLEVLHLSLKNVTEQGFIALSKNCPKLRILKLHYPTAKDQEMEYLTTYFPNLEMLAFDAETISEKGIAFLSKCANLRVLKIGNLKNMETLCIQTIPEALSQLEVLEITHKDLIILKELPHLICNMPNLVYLQIKSDSNISTQKHLNDLRKEHPHLLEKPPTRKIKYFLT